MKSDILKSIDQLITDARHLDAINYMLKTAENLMPSPDVLDELRRVKTRWNDLVQRQMRGELTSDFITASTSQITGTLLKIRNLFDKGLSTYKSPKSLKNNEIELLIHTNMYAAMVEDLEISMRTLHPEVRASNLPVLQHVFDITEDLNYEIISLEITALEENMATASVEQKTSSLVKNPLFRDNVITASHTFIKDGKRWKLYSQIINKIEYV